MIRHVVTWDFRDSFTDAQNAVNAQTVKFELEALKGVISEIIELTLHVNELRSSNRAIMLDSLFESEEALYAYQIHPEHKRVSAFVGTVMQNRGCFDYVVE